MVLAQRGGERQDPLAHLEVVADEVVVAQINSSFRDRERVPVERGPINDRLVVTSPETIPD